MVSAVEGDPGLGTTAGYCCIHAAGFIVLGEHWPSHFGKGLSRRVVLLMSRDVGMRAPAEASDQAMMVPVLSYRPMGH